MDAQSPVQTDPASKLSYRLLEPIPAKPQALLLLSHGVRGNETNLVDLAADAPPDTLVAFARGRLTLSPDRYAWFNFTTTPSGPQIVPEEAEQSRLALIQLVASLQRQYRIAPDRTIVAGFSQGGIMSASVGLSAPDHVAGFAVLAGRILPELEPTIAPLEELVRLHAFIAHGHEDDMLGPHWAERSHTWLNRLGVAHELKMYSCGHVVDDGMRAGFKGWLADRLALKADA